MDAVRSRSEYGVNFRGSAWRCEPQRPSLFLCSIASTVPAQTLTGCFLLTEYSVRIQVHSKYGVRSTEYRYSVLGNVLLAETLVHGCPGDDAETMQRLCRYDAAVRSAACMAKLTTVSVERRLCWW